MNLKLFSILSVILLALASACSDEPKEASVCQSEANLAVRTIEEVKAIASSSYSDIFHPSNSRAKSIVKIDDVRCIRSHNSRAGGEELMYIVNFEDNGGYAFISANKNIAPVLAITDAGHFEPETEVENPAIQMVYNNAIDYLQDTPKAAVTPEPMEYLRFEYDTLINKKAEPRIEANWGQDGPGSFFCPNYIIGCGPLAGVMALSYFETPSINITYNNLGVLNLNWNLFKNIEFLNWEHTDFDHLCREMGYRMNADYALDGTGVGFESCHSALNEILPGKISKIYDLSSDPNAYPYPHLVIEDSGIIIIGSSDKNNSTVVHSSHIYVIDGFIYQDVKIRKYADILGKFNQIVSSRLLKEWEEITYLDHVNWGFGGLDNGYFHREILRPSTPAISDGTGKGTSTMNYGYHKYFVVK